MATNIAPAPPKAKPLSAHGYFDVVRFWLRRRANKTELAELAKKCGSLYVENRRARWSGEYRQRVELRQPTRDALEWLAKRDDALINKIEVALDLVFDNPVDADETKRFLNHHLIRRWHGSKQQVFFVEDTRYDAPRSAPNQIVDYYEPHSRVTGELYCAHLEWRANKLRAVRSIGIAAPEELLHFSFREFWSDRLVLVAFDCERLGRCIRNRANGTRSRKPQKVWRRFGNTEVEINADARRGRVARYSPAQEVLDHYRGWNVLRAAQVLSNSAFLPVEGQSS
jgi:hypothetical protein